MRTLPEEVRVVNRSKSGRRVGVLMAVLLAATLTPPSTRAAVIRVPTDITVFGNAVQTAASGDTVQVVGNGGAEFAASDVRIDKDITIQGGWRADFQLRDALTYVTVIRDTTPDTQFFDKPLIRVMGPYRVVLDGLWIWGGTQGILSEAGADLTVRDCTVRAQRNRDPTGTEDIEANRGGGLRIVGGTTLIEDCQISSITTSFGGAGIAVIDAASFVMRNSRIDNCTASRPTGDASGGGLYARNVANLRLENSRLVQTATIQDGGLAYLQGTSGTFVDCVLARGLASRNGGAVFLAGCTSVTFDRCQFDECRGIVGGALAGQSSTGVVVRDSRFETNRAVSQGSALWFSSTSFLVERSEFESNHIEGAPTTVVPAQGGAGYGLSSTGTITDSSFKNEKATGKGGAWFQIGGNVNFVGCRFEGNDAGIFGGGLSIELGGRIGLTRCLLVDNRAKFGGALSASFTGIVDVDHCTITLGTGRSAGGGVYVDTGSSIRLKDTIACCSQSGEMVYCAGGGVTADHCDVWNDGSVNVRVEWGGACPDPTGSNGNLRVNPDFCPADPDFKISSTSPCVGMASDGSDLGWQPAGCSGPVPTSLEQSSWGRIKARWR